MFGDLLVTFDLCLCFVCLFVYCVVIWFDCSLNSLSEWVLYISSSVYLRVCSDQNRLVGPVGPRGVPILNGRNSLLFCLLSWASVGFRGVPWGPVGFCGVVSPKNNFACGANDLYIRLMYPIDLYLVPTGREL